MKKKWIIKLMLILGMTAGVSIAEAANHVVCIEKTDGQVVRIPVSVNSPQMQVSQDNIYVTFNGTSLSLTFEEVKRMYHEKTSTRILQPGNTITLENVNSNMIVLSGLKNNTEVSIADLAGKTLLKKRVTAKTARISTSSLPSGTYIVKTANGETLKFMKQ